ncbi:MAG: hypothetical protein WAN79_07360 [Opitutaceae bacterium]
MVADFVAVWVIAGLKNDQYWPPVNTSATHYARHDVRSLVRVPSNSAFPDSSADFRRTASEIISELRMAQSDTDNAERFGNRDSNPRGDASNGLITNYLRPSHEKMANYYKRFKLGASASTDSNAGFGNSIEQISERLETVDPFRGTRAQE